jgi:DNA gyrase subunit A
MSRGIIAISIDKDDELIAARVTSGEDVVFLATHDGMAVRFSEAYDPEKSGGLRPMGRNAAGNKGITLRKGDYVIGTSVTPSAEYRDKRRDELAAEKNLVKDLTKVRSEIDAANDALQKAREASDGEKETDAIKAARKKREAAIEKRDVLDEKLGLSPCLILSVTENGFGKRTNVEEYRLTNRGGSGVINMKATTKTGKVSSIQLVDDTSELMAISQFGKIIRIDTKSIRAAGRSTQGVKLLNLEADDKVAAAVVIPPDESKPEPETGTLLQ